MTGYTVHYSSNNGLTNSVSGLPSTSTSHDITGLTNVIYYISVEATSEQLSGESETMTIILSECFFNDIRFESNGLESSTDCLCHIIFPIDVTSLEGERSSPVIFTIDGQYHYLFLSHSSIEGQADTANIYSITFFSVSH